MTGFIMPNKKTKKAFLKKSLPFVGIFALAIVMLFVLILPSAITSNIECAKLEEETGIIRCDKKFKKIIFVVGDTANTPKVSLDEKYAGLIKYMYDGDKRGFSYISVSEPDSAPKIINISRSLGNAKDDISEQLSQSKAKENGADYLEAIRNAARYSKNKEDALIYVIGSGLSDSGLLNFVSDSLLIKHGEDDIKNSLKNRIADKNELYGLTVIWDRMGETVEPQISLNKALKDKEENIYKNTLSLFGLDSNNLIIVHESFDAEINDVNTLVKTTPIKEEELLFMYSNDNSKLAFVPGTSIFANESEAKAEIKRLVEDHVGYKYIIKSYMSRGMCDYNKDGDLLSGRSNATKNLLLNAGVSNEDIIIEPGEIGDANECPRGPIHEPVVETEAQKNRYVEISLMKK